MFDLQGPMPDSLDSWISVDKKVRRLQPDELAKAKGTPKDWKPEPQKKRKIWRTTGSLVTVVHLWTAATDPLGVWMRSRTSPEPQSDARTPSKSKSKPSPHMGWKNLAVSASEWAVPDPSEGSTWHNAWVSSSRLATQNLPNTWKKGSKLWLAIMRITQRMEPSSCSCCGGSSQRNIGNLCTRDAA